MSGTDIDPIREVRRLHVLLEDWYGGIRADLGPFESSLADGFSAITHDGALYDGPGYLEALHERRDEQAGIVSIDLDQLTAQRSLYGVHQVTFEKQVKTDEETTTSTCSMWLRETSRTATGLQWLHLQETPIEPENENED